MSTADDLRDLAATLRASGEVLAVALGGSRLYGNDRPDSDLDVSLIVRSLPYGRRRPVHRMDGALDLWEIPLTSLAEVLAAGRLRECETIWALQAGHGTVTDPRWEPYLLSLRPSFPSFVRTVEDSVDDPKHRVRLDLFTERAWRTGDTDPRLSAGELAAYRSALATTGCTADEHHRPLGEDESPYGKEGP